MRPRSRASRLAISNRDAVAPANLAVAPTCPRSDGEIFAFQPQSYPAEAPFRRSVLPAARSNHWSFGPILRIKLIPQGRTGVARHPQKNIRFRLEQSLREACWRSIRG